MPKAGSPNIVPIKRRPFDARVMNRPSSSRGLSKRVQAAVDLMVREGKPRIEAAQAVGLADDSLYRAFRNPKVRAFYLSELDTFRTAEKARNLHTGIAVRDDEKQPGKTRLEAAKYLDGNPGGVTVNVGVGLSIMPGYVVDVSRASDETVAAALRKAGSTGNVIEHEADERPADGGALAEAELCQEPE